MRDALPELGLQARIGVNTGEVVTGTEERLATGDAVNVAARLEQAAEPGEVLLGEPTLALVRDAVEVEPVEPLELKGRPSPSPPTGSLRVREAPERTPRDAVRRPRARARVARRGLGTRRHRAALRARHASSATPASASRGSPPSSSRRSTRDVVRGRCLPYGEGITYWPVVEVLKQLDALPSDEPAAAAIRSLLGEKRGATVGRGDRLGVPKTLEQPREQPLVVVFDDIQWGEETFLDLVEHVALLSAARRSCCSASRGPS